MDDVTRLNGLSRLKQFDKNRPEVLDVIVRRSDDDKTQRELGEVLLVFEVLIDGNEDLEALLGQNHQLAVGDASPAHFVNCPDFVLGERFSDARIDALATLV
jgi:hypothetical protein